MKTITDRIYRECQEALEKYGEDALRPDGNPNLDIFDYTINELVGLMRYGEMLTNRASVIIDSLDESYQHGQQAYNVAVSTVKLGDEIAQKGLELAQRLTLIRNSFIDMGLDLGKPEGEDDRPMNPVNGGHPA